MRRPRRFLIFILILLGINTLFFVSWYAFDVQDRVKKIVEREAGKALKGDFEIGSFSISDRQIYAQNIGFAARDGSLNFTAENTRVRYNLLRFIFSGFKIRNLANYVEIDQADIRFLLIPDPSKPKKKFEFPDLLPFFNNLRVTNSSFAIDAKIPLTIGQEGTLEFSEKFHDIQLSLINTKLSTLSLSALGAKNASLNVGAELDKGRLVSSKIDLRGYSPQYVNHPQFSNLSASLDLSAKLSQTQKDSELELTADLSLKDFSAFVLEQFPLRIPSLDFSTQGGNYDAILSQSTLGTSSVKGEIRGYGLPQNPVFAPSQLDLKLDLGMLAAGVGGSVNAGLLVQGSLDEPILDLVAYSDQVHFSGQNVKQIDLRANYSSDTVDLDIRNAIWENQRVSLDGIFGVKNRKLTGKLHTSPINQTYQEMKVTASADLELNFYEAIPEIRAQIINLDFAKDDIHLSSLRGHANLFPLTTETSQNLYLDLALSSPLGIDLELVGDISDGTYLLDADLRSLELAQAWPQKTIDQFHPFLNGEISAFLTGSKTVFSGLLGVELQKGMKVNANLDLIGAYDLASEEGSLSLNIPTGSFNSRPLTLELVAMIKERSLKLNSFRLNGQHLAKGNIDLSKPENLEFEIALTGLSSEEINGYFPDLNLPEINRVSVAAKYSNQENELLDAIFSVGELKFSGLKPLSAILSLKGDAQHADIRGGISNENKQLVSLAGDAILAESWNLRLNALTSNLDMGDLMYSPLAEGSVSGNVGIVVSDALSPQRNITYDARLMSNNFNIPSVATFDEVLVSLAQTDNLLIVESLDVKTNQFGTLTGSGALDYNIFTNKVFDGDHTLDLQAEGLLFEWLENNFEYVRDASGKASLVCSLRALEEQLTVQSGKLLVSDGRLVLDEQPEDIRDIVIDADIVNNQVFFNTISAQMGNGILTAKNRFEDDSGSHFKLGMLDLGTFLVKVDEPGALLYVPEITTSRSKSRVVLRGQNADYATIHGPFEDMRIVAEILVNDANIVYPLKTGNLLNLIYSLRGSIVPVPQSDRESIPMPFTLDLLAIAQENVKYATYPTNFLLTPGGYMRIHYNGQKWLPQESSLTSEQGNMDFFGTKFAMEQLDFNISGSQKVITINGSLTHESADGTLITLKVDTDMEEPQESILKRVRFSLDSDNPDDRSIASILGRMRYSASSEQLSATQQGNILQDEALSLISENLNTSILSPILYPLENNIRRLLKLDDFSVRAGFIQNLFMEYSTDPNKLVDYTDMNHFMKNISQFSSSILLNNLSIRASKYLGRKFFLDYNLTLQEATNLQNQTEIVVSHDSSLRWYLPHQFRLAYNLKYEPSQAQISHGLMLQRSFKFWGI